MSPPMPISPQLKALRWRLLASSLGVIGCTLVLFGMVVYQVVAQSLEQKSDRQLNELANAAAHSLPAIAANPERVTSRTVRAIDNDGDLDIPWQDLRRDQQSLEWFDAGGQVLARAGQVLPLPPFLPPSELMQEVVKEYPDTAYRTEAHSNDTSRNDASNNTNEIHTFAIHTLTLPVYRNVGERAEARKGAGQLVLQGYVRVGESNQLIEEELARLRSGLQWGSVLALLLSAVGGWWLTQQSIQPIDRSIRQLKQFTADASHELRNPLTAIKASVEVMQSHQERFHAADLRKLEAIASATNQMSQLVNDLLWLARSDRTVLSPSSHVIIPIHELLEDVLDQYLSQAEQKHITVKTTFLESASVSGDPSQLKRLFSNLLTNALHYTPAGGTVTLTSTNQADTVLVQIWDTGIGIAPEHLPYIFDRFWRADEGRARPEGGSGLGLAIAQAIAHQYDGEITVTSTPGQGSCFQVELPLG